MRAYLSRAQERPVSVRNRDYRKDVGALGSRPLFVLENRVLAAVVVYVCLGDVVGVERVFRIAEIEVYSDGEFTFGDDSSQLRHRCFRC